MELSIYEDVKDLSRKFSNDNFFYKKNHIKAQMIQYKNIHSS